MASHQMQQREGVFRSRRLVLAGNESAIDDHLRRVRLNTRIDSAGSLKHLLRVVRNDKAAAEHRLQLFIGFISEACDLAPADAIGDITQGDSAVADGADHLVFRPEVFECPRHIFIRIEIEGRTAAAGNVDCVIRGQVDVAQLPLARAQAMSGDKTSARNSYQEFFALWKDADPDVPGYRQAEAEYAKLN
jgi:hypothetical protein